MNIDHIGIAVKSIESSIELWRTAFGYRPMTEPVLNTRQKVRVVFLSKENSIAVKLIEPSDETSPIYPFVQKGGGLHHLCFKCDDVSTGVEGLRSKRFRVLAAPQPGEAFDNELIAFVLAPNGLNIELIDTDRRAKRIGD